VTLPAPFQIGLACYAAALVAAALALRDGPRLATIARLALACGAMVHGASLASSAHASGRFPITSLREFVLALVAAFALAAVLLEVARGMRLACFAAAGVSLALAAATAAFLGHAAADRPADAPDPGTFWPGIHVLLVLAAYASFAVAFTAGVLYLGTRAQLKKHQPPSWLERMPSLETSLRVNRAAVWVGFVSLTAGILVGYLHARNVVAGNEWRLDPKVLLATLTWACYLAVLALALIPRLRGSAVVRLSVGSFAIAILSLWSSAVWSGFHRYP
jgi:ABC-type uncharacterized transport system permease subunit